MSPIHSGDSDVHLSALYQTHRVCVSVSADRRGSPLLPVADVSPCGWSLTVLLRG